MFDCIAYHSLGLQSLKWFYCLTSIFIFHFIHFDLHVSCIRFFHFQSITSVSIVMIVPESRSCENVAGRKSFNQVVKLNPDKLNWIAKQASENYER